MTKSKNEQGKLTKQIDAIEEAYEFMLAYAAQGRQGDEDSGTEENIRSFLEKAYTALEGLGASSLESVEKYGAGSVESYQNFLDVLNQDIGKAQATIQMVMAQPLISSQLIDNLNASIHIRALLTDLFLIDETLKKQDQA